MLKRKWQVLITKRNVPKRLWDFGLICCAEILSHTARGPDTCTGYEDVTGKTPDVSSWLEFTFFDLVWFWKDAKMDMTDEKAQFGYWLGVSQNVGSVLTYWILTESGKVIARSTVHHVTREDLLDPQKKTRFD